MESAGILTQSHIEHLKNEDSIVLYNLSRFCNTTKNDLIHALELRNKPFAMWKVLVKNDLKMTDLVYWYHILEKTVWKKTRTILNPEIWIKHIQEQISERFTRVPVSLAATGGKPWDSHIRNAELHKHNPYLLTMDLKNAYPSIWTQRIYSNIQWALLKNLKIRAPTLRWDEDKDLFIKAITHLCVHQNQLPQWASTSSQLINMILSSVDADIEEKMLELVWENGIYTRYIDDISISFPHYPSMEILKEKSQWYIDSAKKITTAHDQLIAIKELVQSFSNEVFHIADNYEFSYIQSLVRTLETELNKHKNHSNGSEIYWYIWILHNYKNQIINIHTHIRDMQDNFLKVLSSKWWTANQKKSKIYTPQSNRLREITWITYTPDGRRWINPQKKAATIRMFKDLGTMNNAEIADNSFYKYHFCKINDDNIYGSRLEVDNEKVVRVIQWKYNYLLTVYGKGKIPQDIQKPYEILKKRRDISDADTIVPKQEFAPGDDLAF